MAKMIHDTGINCRLPQTPRTPSTAAAHYFDDVYAKALTRRNTGVSTPGPTGPRMRRSSTSRSLGNHSVANGAFVRNGDDENGEGSGYFGRVTDSDPFGEEEKLERERRKSMADSHTENFIAEHLHRVQTGDPAAVYEDEFEAQLD